MAKNGRDGYYTAIEDTQGVYSRNLKLFEHFMENLKNENWSKQTMKIEKIN